MSKEEVSKEKDEKEEDKDTRSPGWRREGGRRRRRREDLGLLSQVRSLPGVTRARGFPRGGGAHAARPSADSAKLKTKVRACTTSPTSCRPCGSSRRHTLWTPRSPRSAGWAWRRISPPPPPPPTARPAPRSAPSHRGRLWGTPHERADARVQPALVHAQLARAHDPNAPALAALVRAPGTGAGKAKRGSGSAAPSAARPRAAAARDPARRSTPPRPGRAAALRNEPGGLEADVPAPPRTPRGGSGSGSGQARAPGSPLRAPPACASWGGRRPVDGARPGARPRRPRRRRPRSRRPRCRPR